MMSQLPPTLVSLFIVLFGLVVGSFLNVVIYRLPRERSVVRPRSECTSCHAPISWHENIPLISYLILRGKCSKCGAKISARYPFVEFITAFLFLLTWRGLGLDVAQFRNWFFVSICVAVTFIDLDFRIIPDELSLGGWLIGLLTAYWDARNGFGHLIYASFAGFGVFFLFGILYEKITGRVGLGGGDIKFMGTIGAFLGLAGVWSTVLISSIVGSIVGLAYGWWEQRKEKLKRIEAKLVKQAETKLEEGSLSSEADISLDQGDVIPPGTILKAAIPFGPFLVTGALIELIYEVSKWMSP